MISWNRREDWSNTAVQFVGCAVVAVLLPYGVLSAVIDADALATLQDTMLGCLVAIILGTWLLRAFSTYPGVHMSTGILPAMGAAYSLLLMFFVFARFPYNRQLLLLAVVLSIAWLFFHYLRLQPKKKIRIGYIDLKGTTPPPLLPTVEWIAIDEPKFGQARQFDAITADLKADLPADFERLLADLSLADIPVFHHKHLFESLTGMVELEHLSETSFGSLVPLSAYRRIKYGSDRLLAAIALVVLAPLFLVIALAVRLSTPGPVIFRQVRTGYRGEPFVMLKFRTMRNEGDKSAEREAAMTKISDKRVTPLGRRLRETRLDELPQIVNILKGEMSWIGPRPEAQILSSWYESELPFYRYRHIVRPGLTGWAQVNQGHVAEMDDVKKKLHFDFYYIKNFSPSMDALIAAKTITTMITGFGSR